LAAPLDGAWVAVMAESDGKPAPQLKEHVLRFQDDKFTITLKDKVLYEGTFKVDAAAKPPAIDFMHTAGQAKGKTWKGIYALDKDSLKICDNAPDTTKPRPTELKGLPGYTCVTFQGMK
jgi:uncharacterized protein (TIGR03067 family)